MAIPRASISDTFLYLRVKSPRLESGPLRCLCLPLASARSRSLRCRLRPVRFAAGEVAPSESGRGPFLRRFPVPIHGLSRLFRCARGRLHARAQRGERASHQTRDRGSPLPSPTPRESHAPTVAEWCRKGISAPLAERAQVIRVVLAVFQHVSDSTEWPAQWACRNVDRHVRHHYGRDRRSAAARDRRHQTTRKSRLACLTWRRGSAVDAPRWWRTSPGLATLDPPPN